jgi:hypothetical protein
MPTSIHMRLTEKKPSGPDRPSTIVLEASDRDEEEIIERYRLTTGDHARFGMLRMQYLGDYYLVFPTVFRNRHDYRAVSLKLKSTDPASGMYSGDLHLREPGTRGTVEYEPSEERFRVRVYRDEALEFDTVFLQLNEGKDGDFTVRVPSLGHMAVVQISRYNYRLQVLAGMAAFVLFLLVRMVFRPVQIWLWTEKGNTLFYTPRRTMRKVLHRL